MTRIASSAVNVLLQYILDGTGLNCIDADECAMDPRICGNGTCDNIPGGYECRCNRGFMQGPEQYYIASIRMARFAANVHILDGTGLNCIDADECAMDPRICGNGTCDNIPGGYECRCNRGFMQGPEQTDCICVGVKPTQSTTEGDTNSFFRCECPPGYILDGTGLNCIDADECAMDPRICGNGTCDNIPGGYECRCNRGFMQGPEQYYIGMNTDGSFRCECPPGDILDGTGLNCIDADECAMDPRICGNGTCDNIPGGYECRCNRGFMQGPEQTCVDIDECSENMHKCMFRCHNTAGSFRCTCPYGYTLADDGVHCRDIDECATQPDICPNACENTVGSYLCKCDEARCTCPYGYTLADDGVHCRDIDECATQPDICPNACENTVGSYLCKCDEARCTCPYGYTLADDGVHCRDIDECATNAARHLP
ncbi:calcium-binding EGF domain-containing protein [Phthorimaea operculella]|nr:calcium-binding EGF domain-containing protein [Phthorimaea operculella]